MTRPIDLPQLRDPVVLAAFEGWNDAGDAASDALKHLHDLWGAEPLVAMDPDPYYDFQTARPSVKLNPDGTRRIVWQTTRLSWTRPPGVHRDVVLVRGVEPSMHWRAFTEELMGYCERLGVQRFVTVGALLADVPHTRPIPITSTTEDPQLRERLALQESQYEGPTGILGVLQDAATRRGMAGISLWAAVPHYVARPPSPKAVVALLGRIEELLETTISMGTLADDAEAWEHGVNELANEDEDVAEYVRSLEQAKDTADLPEASGEAIARDFERYLRRRDQG